MNLLKQRALNAAPVPVRGVRRLKVWMTCAIVLGAHLGAARAAVTFPRAFAPSEGLTAPVEKPFRDEICLNGRWQFQPVPLPADFKPNVGAPPVLPPPTANHWETTPIKIPSPWNVNAFSRGDGGDFRCFPSYPAAWETAEMGWLRRSFPVPSLWKGRRLRLHFEAVAGDAVVFVNGHKVASNFDLFLPFEADVTDAVKFGGTNEIRVGVRKASLFNDGRTVGSRPYPGGSFWGQHIVGIWQDVFLEALPAVRVDDATVRPLVSRDTLETDVTLCNDTARAETVRVGGEVRPWVNGAGPSTLDAPEPRWTLGPPALRLPAQGVTLAPGQTQTVTLRQIVGGRLKLWSPDAPHLYGLVLSVTRGSQIIDRRFMRFGWREWTFSGSRQLLNGRPFELRGDSWHFMGIPQMTRRYAWAWFTALKAAHGNAVRLHAQPYPRFYLDMADQMGVCVLDETAIWGSDAGHKYDAPDFWTRAGDQVARLVTRDRSHASVFGWSVSNEVAWYIDRNKYPALFPRLQQGWQDWLQTARRLDPTRPWVSTDGDGDADGIMPTVVLHYAKLDSVAQGAKPYGVGETGGAYSNTPKQVAPWIGPRAFESQQGRMDGIATEAYELIVPQRRMKADYASVFNLVWYGLRPLELGLPDTTRPPTPRDGVFFGAYRENQPGVQPERLGPYCTTLNPGYDPRLPLYKPWPLFDAIKAAYAPGGPAPSPWDHHRVPAKAAVPPTPAPLSAVSVLAGPGSTLPTQLNALGATVAVAGTLDNAHLIVIDGVNPPADLTARAAQIAHLVQAGAMCFVWGVAPASLPALNALLPHPLRLTDHGASSFLVEAADPLLAGLDNGDFYFAEITTRDVSQYGLKIDDAQTLLAACPTDWRRWNFRSEATKTAATVRSEREGTPAGPALVSVVQGRGRFLVSALDTRSGPSELLGVFKRVLANSGLTLVERKMDPEDAFDAFGTLKRSLVCGAFPAPSAAVAYDTDAVGIGPALRPRAGDTSGGLAWRVAQAGDGGVFDFRKPALPGPQTNVAAYLSFWVWSPRALDNLLLEPNLPKVDLLAGSDDGCQIWLNSKLVAQDRGTHPLTPGAVKCETLPLQRGWNQFVVKVVQGEGEWQFQATLRSSDPLFLPQLRTSIVLPTVAAP